VGGPLPAQHAGKSMVRGMHRTTCRTGAKPLSQPKRPLHGLLCGAHAPGVRLGGVALSLSLSARERVLRKEASFKYVSTDKQLADMFTKPLPVGKHSACCIGIGMG
jgi:hypothetical protein